MKKLILIAFLLTTAGISARDLSLDQALKLALEHSLALKAAEENRLSAERLVSAATAERFPTLSLDASARYVDQVPTMTIEIPGMGSLNRELGSNESYQADWRLRVPLYTGGRISSAVAMARSSHEYQAAINDLQRDQVLLQARLDYFNLARAIELQRAAEASFRRTEVIQSDVRSLFDAGAADSLDLLDARLALTKTRFQVRQAEINVQSGRIYLLSRLGLSASDPIVLTDSLPDPAVELARLSVTRIKPELTAAAAGIKLGQAKVSNEGSAYFPSLSAFGGYSYGKPNLDQFNNTWSDYFTVGAQLQWSFNLGGRTSSRKKSTLHDLEAARRHYDDVAESVTREADLAFEQLRLAHTKYYSALDEWRVAGADFDFARAQHLNGALTSNRLLEIEASLSQAEASLAASKLDFYIAQSAYYFSMADENLGKGL
jgi:outer membrane protein